MMGERPGPSSASAAAAEGAGAKRLFIDEVQNAEGFEPLINGYRAEGG